MAWCNAYTRCLQLRTEKEGIKDQKWPKPLDPKEVVTIEKLTISNMYEIEALIEVLARKRIVIKKEILGKIKRERNYLLFINSYKTKDLQILIAMINI